MTDPFEITRKQVESELKEYFENDLGIDSENVKEGSVLMGDSSDESLMLDENDMVEVIAFVNDKYDLKITSAESEQLKTFGQLVDFILKNHK